MPDAGAYSYLKRLLIGRPIPTHLAPHKRLFRLTAAIATIAVLAGVAILMWLAPWPVDAVTAIAASAAWASWVDGQEKQRT